MNSWAATSTVHEIDVPEEECGIVTLETGGDLAAIHFQEGTTYLINVDTGVTTPLPINGPKSIVP